MALTKGTDGTTISVYQDTAATPSDIGIAMARLKTAFPKMDVSFFNLLAERIIDNEFTSKRLKDSINDIIDNFRYKELTIADVIKFDRRVKLYTHNEVCTMVSKGLAAFNDFNIREINGIYYRVKKNENG